MSDAWPSRVYKSWGYPAFFIFWGILGFKEGHGIVCISDGF